MKTVSSVCEAIDIAMTGGQASVKIGPATMIAGIRKESVFIDLECDHFFDDGICLLCDEPDPVEKEQ